MSLKKACPKDHFPLPKIDQLVDATIGYQRLSFLDTCSGYNQIPMHSEDEEKTSFITPRGLFVYKVMPFGLKNFGSTYQRFITKIFAGLLGSIVEAYIYDTVAKNWRTEDHIADLETVFYVLRNYNMKLNSSMYFWGSLGNFLGHIVSQKGIETNPAQSKALLETTEPKTAKEIQVLTGRIAALNRFIS